MTDQWYYRGSCPRCGNIKYGPEPGRDPPGTPCGGEDCPVTGNDFLYRGHMDPDTGTLADFPS